MSVVTKKSNPELYNALFPEDEIKEILDIERYRNKDGYVENISLSPSEIHKLYNCIVNLQEEIEGYKQERERILNKLDYVKKNKELQEENERLKELCDKYEEEHKTTFEYWKRLVKEDYKSRNEKAIEYLANCNWNCKDFENLYDILNGGDDNE